MQSKSNRVISLAMSAALMLTNMIAPMKVYADDAMDTYVEYGEEDSIPAEPETQAPAIEYTITLPYYEDIVYMVDEGRIYQPEDKKPEDKDILLKYLADEKVEFAFTPYNDVTVTELHRKKISGSHWFMKVRLRTIRWKLFRSRQRRSLFRQCRKMLARKTMRK